MKKICFFIRHMLQYIVCTGGIYYHRVYSTPRRAFQRQIYGVYGGYNMKKLFVPFALIFSLLLAVSFSAACNADGGAEEPIVSKEWKFDSEVHWHPCINSDKKFDIAPHSYIEGDSVRCHICGYRREYTDEEKLAEWKAGILATIGYTGDYSCDYVRDNPDADGKISGREIFRESRSGLRFFCEDARYIGDITKETPDERKLSALIPRSDGAIIRYTEEEEGGTLRTYREDGAPSDADDLSRCPPLSALDGTGLETIRTIEDVTGLRAALASAFPGRELESVALVRNGDGSVTMRAHYLGSSRDEKITEDDYVRTDYDITISVTVSGGKVSMTSYSYDIRKTYTDRSDLSGGMFMTVRVSYSFDETGYSEITKRA